MSAFTTLSPSASAPPPPSAGVTVIRPRRGWRRIDLAGLWQHRDLLTLLCWRDIKVRYKQTILGAAWAVLQPLLTMVILSVVFGRLLGVAAHAGDIPYPVFLYAGLLPWTLFAATVGAAGQSVVNQASLLSKVYFPRLILPVSAAGAPMLDFLVASVVLGGLMAWFGVAPTWELTLLPLLTLAVLAAALGVGILIAALTVTYRDFRFVVPFALQVWFFVSPVIAPTTIVPERFRWLLNLNPMCGTLSAFRAAVLGLPPDWAAWSVSAAVACGCLILGLIVFARAEQRFADVV